MNGFLAIDAFQGTEYFAVSEVSSAEAVSLYLYRLVLSSHKQGNHQLTVYTDNNSTHKAQMREKLDELVTSDEKLIDFHIDIKYTPPYSPDFNLSEYLIHLTRLRLLHHLPAKATIQDVEKRLYDFFDAKQLQTRRQIRNTINHILALAGLPEGLDSGI